MSATRDLPVIVLRPGERLADAMLKRFVRLRAPIIAEAKKRAFYLPPSARRRAKARRAAQRRRDQHGAGRGTAPRTTSDPAVALAPGAAPGVDVPEMPTDVVAPRADVPEMWGAGGRVRCHPHGPDHDRHPAGVTTRGTTAR
jgi:ribosomal protein S21